MDRDGAFFVLSAASAVCNRLQLIWADMGYRGARLKTWIEQELKWKMEIVKRPSKWGRYPIDVEPPPMPAFTVLRRRSRRRAHLRVDWALPEDEQRL
jgi:transposase